MAVLTAKRRTSLNRGFAAFSRVRHSAGPLILRVRYWPEFMPTAEEVNTAKSTKKSKKQRSARLSPYQ
jgi:hypothetical protein